MTEPIVWIILLGLAIAITGIYLLSRQIEKHLHDTTKIVHYGNEMILERLEQLTGSPGTVSQPSVGVILERRCVDRRNLTPLAIENPGKTERRGTPGRRLADFPRAIRVGYSS